MCGIVAARHSFAGRLVLTGLATLEYRGYDSAGIAVLDAGRRLRTVRATGPLNKLKAEIGDDPGVLDPASGLAIGHTRWATHGAVTVNNAHPLTDCANRVAVVHNGVLDNADALRRELRLAGHRLHSDVDSELIAHLVEDELAAGNAPFEAMAKAVARLEGTWAVAALVANVDSLLLARRRSPLLVRGTPDQLLVASDPAATREVPGPLRSLDDGDVVELASRWRWLRTDGSDALPPPLAESRPAQPATARTPLRDMPSPQARHDTVTATEMAEQDAMVRRLVDEILARRSRPAAWRDLGLPVPGRIALLGCGTSFHAAQVTARTVTALSGIGATASIASEYERDRPDRPDLVVAISQSGETADMLAALDRVEAPTLAVTNNTVSSLARRADGVIDCSAGYERGVAATKTFTAQVLAGIGLALSLARALGRTGTAGGAERELRLLPDEFADATRQASPLTDTRLRELSGAAGWLFLGTGSGLPYAAEGALKLKEISYRWAQCYPAAELKHGPLALVEQGTPVVVIDNGSPRLDTTIAEITARGGQVIRLGRGIGGSCAARPWGPLHTLPRLQHLAVTVATMLGRDIDRPRNLAKSVTVG